MIMRTICLKLYKLSGIKREIIEEAMTDYTNAFGYLLKEAYDEVKTIEEKYKDSFGRYKGVKLSKWVDSPKGKELNRFNAEPFKDSLKLDFGATFAGYLNLRKTGREAGYPEENSLRPILFCRYSPIRDYCLLYDRDKDKYYVKLYLMNNKSKLKREVKASKGKRLYYIYKDGEELKESAKKERFIIVPLSFGKWQESYLKMGLSNPEILKTARLIKRENDFYLYINIKLDEPMKIEPSTFLGVCRSIKSPAHMSLADSEGSLIKSIPISLAEVTQNVKNIPNINKLHVIANQIIKYAVKNKSQIVVENLADKGDMLHWIGKNGKEYSPVLSTSNYRRLVSIIKYKAEGNGLPTPIQVSPVGVFYTCPQCGLNTKNNRFSHNMFLCTVCGKASNLDDLGSFNLAHRIIKYNNELIRIRAEVLDEGIKFEHKLLDFESFIKNDPDIMRNLEIELMKQVETFEKDYNFRIKDKNIQQKFSIIKKLKMKSNILDSVEIVSVI